MLSIDHNLPEVEQKELACEIILKTLRNMKGKELAPYLSEFTYGHAEKTVEVVLRFPVRTHVVDSLVGNREGNGV